MLYKSVKCIDKQITSLHSLNIKLKYYNDLNYIEIQLSKYWNEIILMGNKNGVV